MDEAQTSLGIGPRAARRRVVWAAWATVLVLGWVGYAVARLDGRPLHWGSLQTDQYNLLMHGFLKGHLYMDLEVPDALLRCPNPYDPAQRPAEAAFDTVFFGGRYYLYHGITPVLTLLLPFRLVTGFDLPLALAVWFFCLGGAVASGAMLYEVGRGCRPEASPWSLAGLTVGVWVCSRATVLLCHHQFYDLAIASGSCFSALALYALARAYRDARLSPPWLVVASLCFGLATGARLNLLIASLGVCALVLAGGHWRDPRRLLALTLPLMTVLLGLAWYNHARFDTMWETGQNYQLTGLKEYEHPRFHPRNLAYNARAYFFEPPTPTAQFPFLGPPSRPAPPKDHAGVQEVQALLPGLPFLALVFLLPVRLLRAGPAVPLVSVVLGFTVLTTSVDLLCIWAIARYVGDFAPWWALSAGICWLLRPPKPLIWPTRIAWGMLWAWTLSFETLYCVSLYGHVKACNPGLYAALARPCDTVAYRLLHLPGTPQGALRLTVLVSDPPPGARCMLVEEGSEMARDRLELEVPNQGLARFVFHHEGVPPRMSRVFAWPAGTRRSVTISAGFLFPPATSSEYATRSAMVAHARRLYVGVDQETVLDEHQRFHPVSLFRHYRPLPQTSDAITVESLAPASDPPWTPPPAFHGQLRARVHFVPPAGPTQEPLLELGTTGSADVFFVRWLDSRTLVFGLDHWGSKPLLSAPTPIVPGRPYRLVLTLGENKQGERPVELRLDDRPVWCLKTHLYDTEPEDLAVGADRVGSTLVSPRFTGTIEVEP